MTKKETGSLFGCCASPPERSRPAADEERNERRESRVSCKAMTISGNGHQTRAETALLQHSASYPVLRPIHGAGRSAASANDTAASIIWQIPIPDLSRVELAALLASGRSAPRFTT